MTSQISPWHPCWHLVWIPLVTIPLILVVRWTAMGVTNATVAGGDTQQVPVQLARGGLVAVTAAISVPSDAWAELMLALTCWETHGTWVEVATERFVWTPNASVCPPYDTYPKELPKLDALTSPRPSSRLACAVMGMLLPSKHRARHGKQSSEALFVGDSISLQYYRTFADWPEGSNRKSQRLSPSATESTIAYIKARPTQPQIHHRGNATQKEVVAPKSPRALAAATSAPRWHVHNRCPIQNGDAT